MSKGSKAGGSIGIAGLLGILFVGLKLTGFITWSWWWVTLPFWGGLALWGAIMLVLVAIWGVAVWLDGRRLRKRRQWE